MIWCLNVVIIRIAFLTGLSLSSFVLCLYSVRAGKRLIVEWEVLRINSCDIEMSLIFDVMSLCFLALVSIISSIVLNYRASYIEGDKNIDRFLYLVLGFVVSICLLIVSPNLIRILLG